MKELVFANAEDVIDKLNPDEPVYCFRPHVLREKAIHFTHLFPGTTLYAVKCNSHVGVLRCLYEAGIHQFDTASLAEIKTINELFPKAHCAFMHPVKSRAAIREAYFNYGIRHFVVDSLEELEKIEVETKEAPDLVIFVRFKTGAHQGVEYNLSAKFGSDMHTTLALIKHVTKRGYTLGIAFHTGSQCNDKIVYQLAIEQLDDILKRASVIPKYVDVGGGFPTYYAGIELPPLSDYMKTITDAIKKIPSHTEFTLLAEPGRALVDEAFSLLIQVHLRKGNQLHVNDGVYGGLTEIPFLHNGMHLPARLLNHTNHTPHKNKWFTLYGPTGRENDIMKHALHLPDDVKEGDWIEVGLCGAYTHSTSTEFSGFRSQKVVTVLDEPFYR